MKNLLVILSLFLLCSCISMQIAPVRTSSFVDFTKYSNFYLSQATTADFKYSPLGVVTSFCRSGNEKTRQDKITRDDVYSPAGNFTYIAATAQEAVSLLCEKAQAIGANGILNLKIDYFPDTYPNSFLYFGYSASGMAISH